MEIENPNHYFYACNGDVLKSLEDLLNFLKNANEEKISTHLNEERNDFSNWIKDILKDKTLAKNFQKTLDKEKLIKAVERRIKSRNKKDKHFVISQIQEAING